MSRNFAKTMTYMCLHLLIGFAVAYALTGSLTVAGGIALIEPVVNTAAFYVHERLWSARGTRYRVLHAHG